MVSVKDSNYPWGFRRSAFVLCSGNKPWKSTGHWMGRLPKDWLQVEFPVKCHVVAIGTKGWKHPYYDPEHKYVTKYELRYKNESGKYLPLGIFTGNSDIHKEAISRLDSGKEKLETTGIRIIPLERNRGGFVGAKCLRIAIYGKELEATEKKLEDGGLRAKQFSGTVVSLIKHDTEKNKALPRKTKSSKYSPEWGWSKPVNNREKRDAMIVASGGYDVAVKKNGMPELAI